MRELLLGLDLGIASCGWSLIEIEQNAARILALGTRMWDAPEDPKKGTPNNAKRRLHRGQRRVIDRRRKRMNLIRDLLHEAGLLATTGKHTLKMKGVDPWQIRVAGLDRILRPEEFAAALGHIARHRGFRSNAKNDRGANAPAEDKKMLGALAKSREHLAKWRTVGEMIECDPNFLGRRRNRGGDYSRSVLRADLEHEMRTIFETQRRLGNSLAGIEFETLFAETAFTQRPLQDSESMVANCIFEPTEMRTCKQSPSFERFRLLSRLAALRIQSGKTERPLSRDEISTASAAALDNKGYSFTRLRKVLDLDAAQRFAGTAPADEKNDFVARSGSASDGTHTLKAALGDAAWNSLAKTPAKLDRVTEVLAFRDDLGNIETGLRETGIDELVITALLEAARRNAFGKFKGAAHISAKAARKIIEFLPEEMDYSRACARAGYDPAARPEVDVDSIKNPVARKALVQAMKQADVLIREFGLPTRIHVELARDVGKSAEERDEIERGIEKRNKAKDRHKAELREKIGRDGTAEELLRYELWKEQSGFCVYSNKYIEPDRIVASDNTVQVDHILPWSRFGDDSFVNKTLCYAKANQDKRGQTSFEWLGGTSMWDEFVGRVDKLPYDSRRKKRNFLLRVAADIEEKFKTRNLNDTRYAARLFLDALKRKYPKGDEVRIFARPGALTAKLRQAWGLEDWKKDADGKRRSDDRHHALDATIIAAITESRLQALTDLMKNTEKQEWHREEVFAHMPAPWTGFREDVHKALEGVFVSRAERRRARGEAHAATIRQVVERDGEVTEIYERKAVDENFSEKDLTRIKDPERNAATIASIQSWLNSGKPKGVQPLSPKGDPIRKVRLLTNKKRDVEVRGGAADRGEMARVDIFRKKNKKGSWEYCAVPIYPHQVATCETPPNDSLSSGGLETPLDPEHGYVFSLYQNTLLELVKPDGEVIEGYFKGINRNTVSLKVSPHHAANAVRDGIGFKTMKSFRKFTIDRLGRKFEVESELRTWRGKVCISASPRG